MKSFRDLNRNVMGKWHCIEQDLAVPFVMRLAWGNCKILTKPVHLFAKIKHKVMGVTAAVLVSLTSYTRDLASNTVKPKHSTPSPQCKFTHGRGITDIQI